VNGAKSYFTQAFPEYWLYFLGLLFVLATLYLPQGVLGLFEKVKSKLNTKKTENELPSNAVDAEAGQA